MFARYASRRMTRVTRSMTRNTLELDTLKAPMKREVLTTPGISSNIAKYLDKDDEGIVSLFLLLNDQRLRSEMLPYCEHFKAKWDRNVEREERLRIQIQENFKRLALEREQEVRNQQKRTALIRELSKLIKTKDACEEYESFKSATCAVYEYLLDNLADIRLLGERFARSVESGFYRMFDEVEDDDEEFYLQMLNFKDRFQEYFVWAYRFE
jgi:hypothetical protein